MEALPAAETWRGRLGKVGKWPVCVNLEPSGGAQSKHLAAVQIDGETTRRVIFAVRAVDPFMDAAAIAAARGFVPCPARRMNDVGA